MRNFLWLAVAILGSTHAGLASAQTGEDLRQPIAIGQVVTSNLTPSDPKTQSSRAYYKVYKVNVPAGRFVTATLTSTSFQPFVSIAPSVNDDCALDCSSKVGETTRPAVAMRYMTNAGVLEIRVSSFQRGQTGRFSLVVNGAIPSAISNQALGFGQSIAGTLSPGDALTGDDDAPTDVYGLALSAQQSIQIELISPQFEPLLEVYAPNGEAVIELKRRVSEGRNVMQFTPERDGIYQIRVRGEADGGLGRYTLRTGIAPPVIPMPAPIGLVLGRAVGGAISETTPSYEYQGLEIEDRQGVRYSFSAIAGRAYDISASRSPRSRLSPSLIIGTLQGDVLTEMASGAYTNSTRATSALRFVPPLSGVYVVQVGAKSGELGAYNVSVSPSRRQ